MQNPNHAYRKAASNALIISSILLLLTMGLHPSGGNFQHLLKIIPVNVTAHSIAILSIIIGLGGYFGLYKSLPQDSFLSAAGFVAMVVAQAAGLMAATINGLALPLIVNRYRNASVDEITSLSPILRYGSSMNHAFDFILIGSTALAILIWSVLILRTKVFPKWIAWYGIAINGGLLLLLPFGMQVLSVKGFTVFIVALVSWIVLLAILMRRKD